MKAAQRLADVICFVFTWLTGYLSMVWSKRADVCISVGSLLVAAAALIVAFGSEAFENPATLVLVAGLPISMSPCQGMEV